MPTAEMRAVRASRHYLGVAQLSWPERFEVTFRYADGTEVVRSVVTWHNAEKAIEIAQRSASASSEVTATNAVFLGRAPRSGDGTIEVGEDLHDRMEW